MTLSAFFDPLLFSSLCDFSEGEKKVLEAKIQEFRLEIFLKFTIKLIAIV